MTRVRQIVVINLDRDTGRLAHMSGQLGAHNLEFKRFPAIDGRRLPGHLAPYFDKLVLDEARLALLSAGEIGCYAMDHRITFDTRLRRFDDMPFQFETLTRVGDLSYVDHCLTFYRQNREGQDIGTTDDRLFVHFPITAAIRETAMQSGVKSTYKNFLKIQYNTHKWAASNIQPKLARRYRLYMARDLFGPEQLDPSFKTLQRLTKDFPKLQWELIGLFLLYLTQARWVSLPQASDVR